MITKAFIEEIVDSTSVRVRIPVIHKSSESATCTPFDQLPVASLCVIPGIDYFYAVGDVVYVAYEDNQSSKIVVLGKLANVTPSDSYINIRSEIDGGTFGRTNSRILIKGSNSNPKKEELLPRELGINIATDELYLGTNNNGPKQIASMNDVDKCNTDLNNLLELVKLINEDVIESIIIPRGRLKGDVNEDGLLTSEDCELVFKYVSRELPLPDINSELYKVLDVDSDNIITSLDGVYLSRFVLNGYTLGNMPEATGKWVNIPNQPEGSALFYTDIKTRKKYTGMILLSNTGTWFSNATIVNDDTIRIYVFTLPMDDTRCKINDNSI